MHDKEIRTPATAARGRRPAPQHRLTARNIDPHRGLRRLHWEFSTAKLVSLDWNCDNLKNQTHLW